MDDDLAHTLFLGQMLVLTVAAVLLVFIGVRAFNSASVYNAGLDGSVAGAVIIGSPCPTGQASQACSLGPVYSSRSLILNPQYGSPVYIQLSTNGTFYDPNVPVGNYTVRLTNCDYTACMYELPRNITVTAGVTTVVNINIETPGK